MTVFISYSTAKFCGKQRTCVGEPMWLAYSASSVSSHKDGGYNVAMSDFVLRH